MKKTIFGILTAALLLTAGTVSVFAGGHGCGRNYAAAGRGTACTYTAASCHYTDTDGDGICDHCGREQGVCRNNCGRYYTDADGDGVCDNYDGGCRGVGRGNGRGCHGGRNR